MKTSTIALLSLAAGALLTSCGTIGPAYPEKDGCTYLEDRGYSKDLICRLKDRKRLTPSEILDLQASKSSDVRFLVARNPSLSPEQIDVSIAHDDDFTRSGTAHNPSLSDAQIELLTEDKSHTVYSALAGNPALTDKQLFRIREKRDIDDLWFAMNPNCPTLIRDSIKASDNSLAKQYLEITDKRKKDGGYIQDSDGRWYEP